MIQMWLSLSFLDKVFSTFYTGIRTFLTKQAFFGAKYPSYISELSSVRGTYKLYNANRSQILSKLFQYESYYMTHPRTPWTYCKLVETYLKRLDRQNRIAILDWCIRQFLNWFRRAVFPKTNSTLDSENFFVFLNPFWFQPWSLFQCEPSPSCRIERILLF